MNTSLKWAALALLTLPACSSSTPDIDPPLVSSVSAVSPSLVFLARTLDVQVAGSNTDWSSSTTISFGAGVTVNKITAASPTALTANITVAPTAAVGKHDVTVTDGTASEPFVATFEVASPVKVTLQGVEAQGSIFVLHVVNNDLANLFDATSVSPGLFQPPVFTNITIAAPPGAAINVGNVTPFAIDATVLVDVLAPAVKADLDIVSGPMGGTQVHFPVTGGPLNIAARTALPVPSGATAGMQANPFDSQLYTFTPPSGLAIQDLSLSSTVMMFAGAGALLPKSGKFKDLISFSGAPSTFLTKTNDPFFYVYWDNTGATGYSYTISHVETTATAFTETEPNNAKGTATPLASLPAVVTNGALDTATDQDWYAYTAVTADIGKKIHAQTIAGDPLAATVVDVFTANGTTSLGGPSADNGGFTDFTSTAITTAGLHYIVVTPSTSTFSPYDPANTHYQAIIRLK